MPRRVFPDTLEGHQAEIEHHLRVLVRKRKWEINDWRRYQCLRDLAHKWGVALAPVSDDKISVISEAVDVIQKASDEKTSNLLDQLNRKRESQ